MRIGVRMQGRFKRLVFAVFLLLVLSACGAGGAGGGNNGDDGMLKGEREVIEMIEDRINFDPDGENVVEMFVREGGLDRKVTMRANGNDLYELTIESELPYELFDVETKEEAEELLAESMAQYENLEGLDYEADFLEPYLYEKLVYNYDELDFDAYNAIDNSTKLDPLKERDLIGQVKWYVEQQYFFLDE